MNWGNLNEEYEGFAWKQLSSNEIDPTVSNQHEFQGASFFGHLLGLEDRRNIITTYYLFGYGEGENIEMVEAVQSTASWYNSRARQLNRSAEWRLYYASDVASLVRSCSEGDLLLLGLRTDGGLSVFLLPQNSPAEAGIRHLLAMGLCDIVERRGVKYMAAYDGDIGLSGAEMCEAVNLSFMTLGQPDIRPPFSTTAENIESDTDAENIFDQMITRWPERLGTSEDVVNLIIDVSGNDSEEICAHPDLVFNRWLELGELSYRAWEKEVMSDFLAPLRRDTNLNDWGFAEQVSKKWMSFRQSRVSRAGRVMELALNKVFLAADLRFDWGKTIQGNKRPDFVFPGVAEYGISEFPHSNLRILGSKTSMKERWRQILAEGDKVINKHGVTRDSAITNDTFAAMRESNFTLVMAKPVIDLYEVQPENLITLEAFISEVKDTQI